MERDFSDLKIRAPKNKILLAAGAGIIAILLAAGGIFAFTRFSKKPPQPQLANSQIPGAGGSNSNQSNSGQGSQAAKSEIPAPWLQKYFGSATCSDQNVCGDGADPDHDGLTNLEEYKLGTDPNNPDSSGSGIADGDKVHIFNQDPLSDHTAGILKYTDAGDLKYKYNSRAHRPYTQAELGQIAANVKKYGLHEPTITTLGSDLVDFYTNGGSTPEANNSGSDSGAAADALNRDAARADAIKAISFALIKYQQDNGAYPDTTDFATMIAAIQPILSAGAAVKTVDPLNAPPYVYAYQSVNSGQDFKLSYYSETQKQEIDIDANQALQQYLKSQEDQRDAQRENDLQQINQALQLYSNDNENPGSPGQKVFPAESAWTQAISKYLTPIPVDPKTQQDYSYTTSPDNSTFAVQAVLEDPPSGDKGYVCTQDGCQYY